MAVEKFWGSVRTAMELFEPNSPKAARTTAWLNRHAVDGFDPLDFDFLADGERERLEASVAAFRQATAKLTPKEPPTAAQLEQGAEALEGILRILDPKHNYSPEFFRIKKILDAELEGKLPCWVKGIVYEPIVDWQGEEGVTVWVIFSDEASGNGRGQAEQVREVNKTVEAAYRWTGTSRFLSVDFRAQAKSETAKVGGR
jgi:hypothetical protein